MEFDAEAMVHNQSSATTNRGIPFPLSWQHTTVDLLFQLEQLMSFHVRKTLRGVSKRRTAKVNI